MSYAILQNAIYDGILSSFKSCDGSRSSKRTDSLHKSFEAHLKEIPHFKGGLFLHEEKVKSADGSFKIDLLHETSNIKTAFLLKLIASSYNKNRKNYANTMMGECYRFLTGNPDRRLGPFNFIPEKMPVFNKVGQIMSLENTNIQNLDYFYEAVKGQFANDPVECNFIFAIDESVLNQAQTREDLYKNLKSLGPAAITLREFETTNTKLHNFLKNEGQ